MPGPGGGPGDTRTGKALLIPLSDTGPWGKGTTWRNDCNTVGQRLGKGSTGHHRPGTLPILGVQESTQEHTSVASKPAAQLTPCMALGKSPLLGPVAGL